MEKIVNDTLAMGNPKLKQVLASNYRHEHTNTLA